MVHLDVKKVEADPRWQRASPALQTGHRPRTTRVVYTYLHSAIDGFSRLAYTEALGCWTGTAVLLHGLCGQLVRRPQSTVDIRPAQFSRTGSVLRPRISVLTR